MDESFQLRFYVHNLGCKVNRVESDTITAALLAAGMTQSPMDESDVVVVNTCTVTGEADTKTRKAIRQASRACSGTVIVTGCAAAIDPESLASLGDNVVVEPGRLAATNAAIALMSQGDASGSAALGQPNSRVGDAFHTRMAIKVQDGCNNRCSYCIVNRARGKSVSMALDDVVAEVAHAADSGLSEVVLTGINIGSYRYELSDGSYAKLPQLIEAILEETSIGRVRLSSIEPPDVTDELIEVLARYPMRFCAHFHMPLQSGCNKTLAAMNRLYSAEEFAAKVDAIRKVAPGAAITTDVIAGFPQESDDDFEESLEFCRQMRFSKIHVFRYSVRPDTPAAAMDGQIKPEIKAQRAARLRKLSDDMRHDDMLSRVGTTELVSMESEHLGMSESYHEVALDDVAAKRGSLLRVEFDGIDDAGRLTGKIV